MLPCCEGRLVFCFASALFEGIRLRYFWYFRLAVFLYSSSIQNSFYFSLSTVHSTKWWLKQRRKKGTDQNEFLILDQLFVPFFIRFIHDLKLQGKFPQRPRRLILHRLQVDWDNHLVRTKGIKEFAKYLEALQGKSQNKGKSDFQDNIENLEIWKFFEQLTSYIARKKH